jgi:hypothetical protein
MRQLAAVSGGSRPCGCGSAGIGPPTEIGAVVDVTVTGGELAQRWATVRFPGRVTAFEAERRLVLHYFDGDFRGTAEWTLSPAGAGHTHIAVRFMADPHGGMRLRARFADVPSINSSVMQEGFRAIEWHAAENRDENPCAEPPGYPLRYDCRADPLE